MIYIKEIIKEVSQFKAKRNKLTANLLEVDEQYNEYLKKSESEYNEKVHQIEDEEKRKISQINEKAKHNISENIKAKESLQDYIGQILQWCPDSVSNYIPNPSQVDQGKVNQLLKRLQEQGIIAWVKRTFKIEGYSSRAEMASDLYFQIIDACAFCDECNFQIESKTKEDNERTITECRRLINEENKRFINKREQLNFEKQKKKEEILISIARLDNSRELSDLYEKINKIQTESQIMYQNWGEYVIPTSMPNKEMLCGCEINVPDNNGLENAVSLPVWIDLYQSNIIIISSDIKSLNKDRKDVFFTQQFISRLLKTIPPEKVTYSIFDSSRKGASLGRLIDVTNIGTTDLNFELFTSDGNDSDSVSCVERRNYLRNIPAKIIKSIGGFNDSLFEYNKITGKFEYPFSWYIDFSFSELSDSKLMEDIKELLMNSEAAGYSFVFVTSSNGANILTNLASQNTKSKIINIDLDNEKCKIDDFELNINKLDDPSIIQISNFVTAIKEYYDVGESIDNRIDSVFMKYTPEIRDASKKIAIPMALDIRGRLIDLELGGDGSVHGFISGGTNSGKSTLLHSIILSACCHYDPNDLEIWIVDYKQTEFHLYKRMTPPHITLIGVSKTADFSFSLIDKIEKEAARRTTLMNRFDAQNLEDYRKHIGENGYENITRLLIIIDEFHEMSQFVSTEIEYRDKLENILREYRAQGINCLLADQTFSTGLGGLTTAAKNQIGVRIAMRNESSPQEIKETLEVDRALYSDSMQNTIAIMGQGDFLMKVYIKGAHGETTGIKLEKFKSIWAKPEDIYPISKQLRSIYKGRCHNDLIYVNTNEHVLWDESEPKALDISEPIRYPNIRLYLGRAATIKPCFGLDLGRQPDENLAIVGGTSYQRWELITAILKSCNYKKYRLKLFLAEFSDLSNDFEKEINELCKEISNAELFKNYEEWCKGLSEIESMIDSRENTEDIVCVFIGLEIANIEMSRLPDRFTKESNLNPFLATINKYAVPANGELTDVSLDHPECNKEYNALPIVEKLFSSGARYGIRCVTEVSVYRQFSKILKIKDMCRHKIAFDMSADDCLMYLGSSNFQKSIGENAIYSDGGKTIRKIIPYKF